MRQERVGCFFVSSIATGLERACLLYTWRSRAAFHQHNCRVQSVIFFLSQF